MYDVFFEEIRNITQQDTNLVKRKDYVGGEEEEEGG